jgi:hypothetical protein
VNKRQKLWKLALPLSVVAATTVVSGVQAAENTDSEVTANTIVNPATVTFAAPAEYPAGLRAWSVTYADFNGDGKADVATGNGGNSMSVFLNKGDGTYSAKTDYASPALPYYLVFDITSADYNGDGKPDIAVSGGNPVGNVLIYLNNGDGTFAAPKVTPIGFGPNQVASADLNRDGKQDLITTNNFSADVSVKLGKGDGTFGQERKFEVGPGPQGITVTDVNGDRVPDLVTGNFGRVKDSVTVLLGRGDGTFHDQQNYSAGISVNDVAAGDFNRDGVTDLVVGEFLTNTVSVLIGRRHGGFWPAKEYSTGTSLNEITVADFNNDGAPDIVTTVSPDANRDPSAPPVPNEQGGGVSLLLGKGDGTFADKTVFPIDGMVVSVQPIDVNGDKRLDLVTASLTKNALQVWLNSGAQ